MLCTSMDVVPPIRCGVCSDVRVTDFQRRCVQHPVSRAMHIGQTARGTLQGAGPPGRRSPPRKVGALDSKFKVNFVFWYVKSSCKYRNDDDDNLIFRCFVVLPIQCVHSLTASELCGAPEDLRRKRSSVGRPGFSGGSICIRSGRR